MQYRLTNHVKIMLLYSSIKYKLEKLNSNFNFQDLEHSAPRIEMAYSYKTETSLGLKTI